MPLCRTTNTTYAARGTTNPNYNARCGELVITAANGKQSIDTVTIGGKAPTYVNGENATNNAIQSAIDAASPGDLIIVNGSFGPSATAPAGTTCKGVTTPTATCVPLAATYNEMLLMWKPVRLQGVVMHATEEIGDCFVHEKTAGVYIFESKLAGGKRRRANGRRPQDLG